MTELVCPGEERVNFGTQRDVLDGTWNRYSREEIHQRLSLQSFVEVDRLYSRMTGSNLLLQLWFQAAHCHRAVWTNWNYELQKYDLQSKMSHSEVIQKIPKSYMHLIPNCFENVLTSFVGITHNTMGLQTQGWEERKYKRVGHKFLNVFQMITVY